MQDNTITLDFVQLTRDLAEQYAKGQISTDTYLTLWEELVHAHVGGNTQNTVAV